MKTFSLTPRGEGAVSGKSGLGFLDVHAHGSLHEILDKKTHKKNHAKSFDSFRLFEEQVIDDERIFEKAVVSLDAVLSPIGTEDVLGTLSVMALFGPIGQQNKTPRFFPFLGKGIWLLKDHGLDLPLSLSNLPWAGFGWSSSGVNRYFVYLSIHLVVRGREGFETF